MIAENPSTSVQPQPDFFAGTQLPSSHFSLAWQALHAFPNVPHASLLG